MKSIQENIKLTGKTMNNENKIIVRIETTYGLERIYPTDRNSILFADIAGQKTLSKQQIEYIKELGFLVEVQQNEVRL